jgi:hypothetical protein
MIHYHDLQLYRVPSLLTDENMQGTEFCKEITPLVLYLEILNIPLDS